MKRRLKFIHFTFDSTFNCICLSHSIKLFEREKRLTSAYSSFDGLCCVKLKVTHTQAEVGQFNNFFFF